MTHEIANHFLLDTRRDIRDTDLNGQNVYLSIKGIGTKVFHDATSQIIDGWLFIWSREETFCVSMEEVGDLVCINVDDNSNVTTL